ncbi:MAG: hypothetical protein LH606_14335 [Cytophagaceae bacterium]|nr:hypothetical protein [Cytophagaceae bacterium]
MKLSLLFTLLAWLTGSVAASAQNASQPDTTSRPGLFTTDSVLAFTLKVPIQRLLKDRGDTTVPHAAQLSYAATAQETVTLPVKLKVRGHFRRQWNNCSFPPLYLDVPKKKAANTPFANQNKLKLVTHCEVEEYVVREYLVYRLYNLLTEHSFRARLCRVTYVDSAGKIPPETRWAALLEDEDDLRKRNGGKPNKLRDITMPNVDSLSMATLGVFEYLIGNTDWSVPNRHNIRLLTVSTHVHPVPVPYDFDYSGIIEAFYAVPPDYLGIASVRERFYRGPAYPETLFQRVFDRFNQLKPQFYALYRNDSRLDPAYVKRTLLYLDEFYADISDPAIVRSIFLDGKRHKGAIKKPTAAPSAQKKSTSGAIAPTSKKPVVKK